MHKSLIHGLTTEEINKGDAISRTISDLPVVAMVARLQEDVTDTDQLYEVAQELREATRELEAATDKLFALYHSAMARVRAEKGL